MKGKKIFSQAEVNQILVLIGEKVVSDSSKQKTIRNKIRNLGFYASDFHIRNGYNQQDFLKIITISDNGNTKLFDGVQFQNNEKVNLNPTSSYRKQSDECYIIDLCDELLKQQASRQHRFVFLKGDSGCKLPVDAYYKSLNLVVEYREVQHTSIVGFFNRRETVSGVGRGEQRKIYDQRRRDTLPKFGINLIELDYHEFEYSSAKRLKKNQEDDLKVLRSKFKNFLT